ncbi:stress responsive A/B barrel domain-containing protein [Colletotrichum sublineola]|nr:stress responsive A/B barrel domain-containing protein [Colletotrichum sublineola]
MSVTHVVQFQFKELVPMEEVKWICESMLALRDNCIHPTSNKMYIKSIAGGVDNSPEGMQDGITHVFVVEFESTDDRDYYVHKDPAHRAFVERAGPSILKARVVDFTPGVFLK